MTTDADEARWLEPLFRAPLAEFIAKRKALAAELKRAGDKALAARVAKLPKPPVPAWLANQLHYERPDAWQEALSAAEAARAAQQQGGQSLSRMQSTLLAQRRALERLVQLAEELAGEQGQPVSRAHLRTLGETLAALVADPAAAPHGCLTRTLEAPSFGSLDLAAMLSAKPPAPPEPGPPPVDARGAAPPAATREERLREARARLRAARRSVEELEVLEAAAAKRLARARDGIGQGKRAVALAEEQLGRARGALEAFHREASAAEHDVKRHAAALREATAEAERAEQALGELE